MFDDGDEYELLGGKPTIENVGNTTTVKFTNIIKQEEISIEVEKKWNIPIKATGATGIKIYLWKNGVQTDLFKDFNYNETNKTQSYTFENLDKYKTENGEIYINKNGNVELNEYEVHEKIENNFQYIVNEEQTNEKTVITNTPKGIIEKVEKKPIDVVFVLDVSNSMNSSGKDDAMVNAINSTLEKIKQINSNSKVGIVAYNEVVTPITDGLIDIEEIGTFKNGTEDKDKYIYYTTKKGEMEIKVVDSTWTSAGIEAGAEMLYKKTKGRVPILILLTDGVPTYYTGENGKKASDLESGLGRGGKTSPKIVYNTIKTAITCKGKIDAAYDEKVSFYTIGLGVKSDKLAMDACLNPIPENVSAYSVENDVENKYKLEDGSYFSLTKCYAEYGPLEDYSDATYYGSGGVDGNDLKKNLAELISVTTKELLTNDQIDKGKIVLTKVDTTEKFEITFGGKPYTVEDAVKDGVLDINGKEYTIYLKELWSTAGGDEKQLYIKYYKSNK